MKTHKFDVEDAQKYGIEKAILLDHLRFHQESNQDHKPMIFDGKPYAYLIPKTVKKMYPYLNPRSVRRWLAELEKDGVIISMKPMIKSFNHTKFYHVVESRKSNKIMNGQNNHSGSRNDQSELENSRDVNTNKNNLSNGGHFNHSGSQNDQSSYITNVYNKLCVEKDTNIVEKIKKASTVKELYKVYGEYRREKFTSFPSLSEIQMIEHTWNQYPLHEVKSAVALTISKGWKNIPWEDWDNLKRGAENFDIRGVSWAKENGFMSIEEAKKHAKKNYNQPLNELSGCYIIREFEGQELVKHV